MRQVLVVGVIMIAIFGGIMSAAEAQNYELRGEVSEQADIFVQSPNDLDLLISRLRLELLSARGDNLAFRVLGSYEYDAVPKEKEWELKEAYIDYYSTLVDIRLGRQVIAWGTADEINPTDILNPQKMTNITDLKSTRKIGLFMVKADWRYHDYALQTIWKPEFDYMHLPELDSPWAFFSLPGVVTLPEPDVPENTLENHEWAVKLSHTGTRFDYSLSYVYGWDNIFTPEIGFDAAMQQVTLQSLRFYRTQMGGGDMAGNLGSIGIWGEAAFFLTEDDQGDDPDVKNPYFQYIIGTDHTFDNGVKIALQYFQELITKIDDDAEETSEEDIISKLGNGMPLQQAMTLRLEKKFGAGETKDVELFMIYDLKYDGLLLKPSFSFSPQDAVTIELGVVIFNGDSTSIFGRFEDNDKVYAKCTYSF